MFRERGCNFDTQAWKRTRRPHNDTGFVKNYTLFLSTFSNNNDPFPAITSVLVQVDQNVTDFWTAGSYKKVQLQGMKSLTDSQETHKAENPSAISELPILNALILLIAFC